MIIETKIDVCINVCLCVCVQESICVLILGGMHVDMCVKARDFAQVSLELYI